MTDPSLVRESRETHLCVCACTYRRPEMLDHLLETLRDQTTDGQFTYSIVVVDNDASETARDVVARARERSGRRIDYAVEPEQNISLARNKALKTGEGDFYAWLDDDEFADKNWLVHLYRAAIGYRADGVLGPVLPYFEVPPPAWIIKGRACERESFPTGTSLTNPRDMRTGNFLIRREALRRSGVQFDPKYGKTGGEDADFFRRLIGAGYSFVWCDEAVAHETLPPSRLKRSYFLKRALLRGVVNAPRARLASLDTLKSVAACAGYAAALPFLALYRHHIFMRYLTKTCDHLGKLLARCGIRVVKQRFA